MLWTFSLIGILIIGSVGLVFQINKKILLKDIQGLFLKGQRLLKDAHHFTQEHSYILDEEVKEIKQFLFKIEQTLTTPSNNKELLQFFGQSQEEYQELEQRVLEKKKNWAVYSEFKENSPYLLANLERRQEEVKLAALQLIKDNMEEGQLIEERRDDVLTELVKAINECKALAKASFYTFNFYILEDIYAECEKALGVGKVFLEEAYYYYQPIKAFISEINRKGTFYLILEENSPEKRGKKRSKDILVSFKTFKETTIGKDYERGFLVAKKRAVNEQSIGLKITVGEKNYKLTKELSNEEFKEMFKELKIKFNGDQDEEGFPLELRLSQLDLLICEKKPKGFAVDHKTKFFLGLPLYELIDQIEKSNGEYLRIE